MKGYDVQKQQIIVLDYCSNHQKLVSIDLDAERILFSKIDTQKFVAVYMDDPNILWGNFCTIE